MVSSKYFAIRVEIKSTSKEVEEKSEKSSRLSSFSVTRHYDILVARNSRSIDRSIEISLQRTVDTYY